MNGHLAQVAALAAHAKARRRDRRFGGDSTYWSQHSTFRYVHDITFRARHGFLGLFQRPKEVAKAPAAWMDLLPDEADVNLFSLGSTRSLPAYVATTFSGGTSEGICVESGGCAVLWLPTWRVVAQYPETRIWSVDFVRSRVPGLEIGVRTVGEATERLALALAQAIAFASAAGLSAWRDKFEQASSHLSAGDPLAPYHPDILPQGAYSLSARQLVAASVEAFVFGGMGSWNDLGFTTREVSERYEKITRNLYEAVLHGLTTAVNSGLVVGSR